MFIFASALLRLYGYPHLIISVFFSQFTYKCRASIIMSSLSLYSDAGNQESKIKSNNLGNSSPAKPPFSDVKAAYVPAGIVFACNFDVHIILCSGDHIVYQKSTFNVRLSLGGNDTLHFMFMCYKNISKLGFKDFY